MSRVLTLSVTALLMCLACHGQAEIQVREQTCADRHCRLAYDTTICEVTEEPVETHLPGNPLCQWDGHRCSAMACGTGGEQPHPEQCPEGSECRIVEFDMWDLMLCVRSETAVADRTSCRQDSDCVPEHCCRPTMCVSRADEVCRSIAGCCACMDCRPCISACRCVNGCCVTSWDEDGCC